MSEQRIGRELRTKIRRSLARSYRLLLQPFGRLALRRAVQRGLPPELVVPLRALIVGAVPGDAAAASARIEAWRAQLATRDEHFRLVMKESTTGVLAWLEGAEDGITMRELATRMSVDQRWGTFLHLCAKAIAARTILEMGACLGISTAYLATSASETRIVSVDASQALAPIIQSTLANVGARGTLLSEPFTVGLPNALRDLGKVDLAFVDGHHDGDATIRYVEEILPSLNAGAIMLLDDIYLYEEMWDAWNRIAARRGFGVAVTVGRFGMLQWQGGDVTARRFDFSRFTGLWRVGESRSRAMMRAAQTSINHEAR